MTTVALAEDTVFVSRITRWKKFSKICAALSIFSALAYIGLQGYYFLRVDDPLFIAIIMLNAAIAIGFGFYFERKLYRMLTAFNETDPSERIEPDAAIDSIFHHWFAGWAAVLFSGGLALWVFLLFPWNEHSSIWQAQPLNLALAFFLFCSNLIIGYGLYCIVRFWLLAWVRIERMTLNVLEPTRPDLAMYRDIIGDLVILIAGIATLAVISLPLSQIDLGITTVLFSLAALGTVIGSYLLPMLPMTRKFHQMKNAELHRLERRINRLYKSMMTADDPTSQKAQMEGYVALRDQLKAVKTLPPGGEFSIITSVTVTFMTFLPAIFEWAKWLVTPQ